MVRYHSSNFLLLKATVSVITSVGKLLCPLIAHTLTEEDALNSRIKPDSITGAAKVDRTPLRSGMAPDCQLDIVFRNFTMFWRPDAEHFPLVLHCDVTCKAMINLTGPAFSSQEPVSWDLRDLAMAHAYRSTTTRPSVLDS